MTVVAGYVRMLLKDRAGALNPEQRRLLEEAERSCGRLSMLLAEMSDLSNLEAGTATFNRSAVDLTTLVVDTIAALPDAADREVRVSFARGNGEGAQVTGDPVRLKAAFTAILHALRRELVTSDELLVSQRAGDYEGQPATWIAFGDARHIETLSAGAEAMLVPFDEWRGGCGLGLAVARRVLDAHGGAIWSPADGTKAGAVVVLPTV